jgi:hypothetical protein
VKEALDNSLNSSMNNALKHYSSMFFLPSLRKAVIGLAVICIGIVGLSTFALFQSIDGLIISLLLGITLLGVSLAFDYVMSEFILPDDPIYTPRRTVALSLFGWVLWGFFILLGVVMGAAFNFFWWVKMCLLGFADFTQCCVPRNFIGNHTTLPCCLLCSAIFLRRSFLSVLEDTYRKSHFSVSALSGCFACSSFCFGLSIRFHFGSIGAADVWDACDASFPGFYAELGCRFE